jgi:hypothetical protein
MHILLWRPALALLSGRERCWGIKFRRQHWSWAGRSGVAEKVAGDVGEVTVGCCRSHCHPRLHLRLLFPWMTSRTGVA